MSSDLDRSVADELRRAQRAAAKPADLSDLPAPSIAALLHERARARPDALFLHYVDEAGGEEERLTYAAFAAAVGRAAALLRSYGVARGDTVATIAHNHWETVVQYFACWCLGVRVMPLVAPALGNDDAGYREECLADWSFKIDNAEARLLLVRSEYLERAHPLRERCATLARIVSVGGGAAADGEEFFRAAAALDPALPAASASTATDSALIVYTSGTTGKPKGVDLSQCHLLYDARGIAAWCDASPARLGHRFMCVLPIHHVNGTVVTLVTPLLLGGSVVLTRAFKPDAFWTRLAAARIQTVSVVPTLLHTLLERREDVSRHDLTGFERIICGAGPLSVKLARQFTDAFGLTICHGYGLSETTCYSCGLPPDISAERYADVMYGWGFPSIGVPFAENDMAILDAEGRPLAATTTPASPQKGEICIRGQNVMNGYFRRPDANAAAFRHGWFHSGDEGFWVERDGRPYFFITGRLKELVIRGGVNISPYEIDEVLQAIPGVARALAVAVPSDHYSEEVGAYVELEEGARLGAMEILQAAYRQLGFSKCPKFVFFAHEVGIAVPYTTTAKPQRGLLEEQLRSRGRFDGLETAQWREPEFRRHIGV